MSVDAPPLDSEAAHGEPEVKRAYPDQSDGLPHLSATTQATMQGRGHDRVWRIASHPCEVILRATLGWQPSLMCHAATLTNRAHATTAALTRTCAARSEETLEDLGNVLAISAEDMGHLVGWEQLRLGGVG